VPQIGYGFGVPLRWPPPARTLARMVAFVRRMVGTGAALLLATGLTAVVVPWAPGAVAAAQAGPCRSGTVSLTFDDGPSPTQTPRLVRILKRAGVPATFFMVGQRVSAAPRVARLVSRSGFLVANHSYAHADMRGQSSAAIRQTLLATGAVLRRAGARPTNLMRPPYGAVNARVLRAIRGTGLQPVMWDVDPRDWESVSADTIAARVLAGLRPQQSNVVLQHDGVGNSPASVSAVPQIISGARRRGYCFVALDERGQPGFPTPQADLVVRRASRTVAEGQRASIMVRLSKPAGRAVTVRLVARNGSAHAGADFTRPPTTLRIPAGRLTATARIPVLRDRLDEPKERFEVHLLRSRGVRLGTTRQVIVVTDRDPAPRVWAVSRSVAEPAAGSAPVPVTIRLARVSGKTVRVSVETVTGTADTSDFVPMSRRLTIPAGTRTVQVPVTVLADALDEPDEAFTLHIQGATYAVAAGDAVVTITPPPN